MLVADPPLCPRCEDRFRATYQSGPKAGAHRPRCTECETERHREWRNKNPESWAQRRLKQYGLSLEEYEDMLESQDWRCAICGKEPERLCVDHDHDTGSVRGLICQSCNKGLGFFRDQPELLELAATYLREHGGE